MQSSQNTLVCTHKFIHLTGALTGLLWSCCDSRCVPLPTSPCGFLSVQPRSARACTQELQVKRNQIIVMVMATIKFMTALSMNKATTTAGRRSLRCSCERWDPIIESTALANSADKINSLHTLEKWRVPDFKNTKQKPSNAHQKKHQKEICSTTANSCQ